MGVSGAISKFGPVWLEEEREVGERRVSLSGELAKFGQPITARHVPRLALVCLIVVGLAAGGEAAEVEVEVEAEAEEEEEEEEEEEGEASLEALSLWRPNRSFGSANNYHSASLL